MADALLNCDHISRVYYKGSGLSKTRLLAVNDVSLGLPSTPEIFTLAGESGSGKTTVAKMILGTVQPSSGRILYKGRDVTQIRRRADRLQFMKEVQPVFQNPFETFNPLKMVDTYLMETARSFGIGSSGDTTAIEKALELVGLSLRELKGRCYPSEMSGGQLQRTSIARALITNPSLLVTDEPVSMIDASLRMSIVNLFKELKEKRGVSVFYITHDLATAYYVSDRIAVMLRGSIVEMGTVQQVLEDPMHPYTKILKESVPVPDPERAWSDSIEVTDFEEQEFALTGCKFADRCPSVMGVCREHDPASIPVDGRTVKCHLYAEQAS